MEKNKFVQQTRIKKLTQGKNVQDSAVVPNLMMLMSIKAHRNMQYA
jgi:hypothetical protein